MVILSFYDSGPACQSLRYGALPQNHRLQQSSGGHPEHRSVHVTCIILARATMASLEPIEETTSLHLIRSGQMGNVLG